MQLLIQLTYEIFLQVEPHLSLQHACPLGHFEGHLQRRNEDMALKVLGHLLS